MAFQPFGFPFEVCASLSPSEAKAAIRAKLKPWMDMKTGARGWMIGPYLCLWATALDAQGPMLFGRISNDRNGVRIHGRAGSNLNGALAIVILTLFMALLTFIAGPEFNIILAMMVALMVIALCAMHYLRREADGLVRFLEKTLAPPASKRGKATRYPPITRPLRLLIEGQPSEEPISGALIAESLRALEPDSFIILESDTEYYIQTARRGDDFVIDTREGSADRHFSAARSTDDGATLFDVDETIAAFLAYATEDNPPAFLQWTRLR